MTILFFCRLIFLKICVKEIWMGRKSTYPMTQWSAVLCLLMGWYTKYHIFPWVSLSHFKPHRSTTVIVSLHPLSPSGLVFWWGMGWALWVYRTCNGERSWSVWHGTALSWMHKPLGWVLSSHGTWKCLHTWQTWERHTLGRRSWCSSWCVLAANTQQRGRPPRPVIWPASAPSDSTCLHHKWLQHAG